MRPDARLSHLLRPRLAALAALAFLAAAAPAQTLSSRAKESGCTDAPRIVDGTSNLYRCNTASGAAAIFNVPDASPPERPPRRNNANGNANPSPPAANTTSPAAPGLPRVDAATQKGRDDLRKRVLQDELATEEKLLADARASYANGSPPALPEERAQPQRYADRIARLREAVLRHERNIEMLRRELGAMR